MLSFAGQLPGISPAAMTIISDTVGLPGGYLALASLGVPPSPCTETCDDTAVTYIAPAFTYNGVPYDRVTMTTNGYLIVGSATDLAIFNERLPTQSHRTMSSRRTGQISTYSAAPWMILAAAHGTQHM